MDAKIKFKFRNLVYKDISMNTYQKFESSKIF